MVFAHFRSIVIPLMSFDLEILHASSFNEFIPFITFSLRNRTWTSHMKTVLVDVNIVSICQILRSK